MACTLPYIQKLSVPSSEKTRLEDLHFQIGQQLRAHQSADGSTFILKGGYLRLNSPGSAARTEQEALLDSINSQYPEPVVRIETIQEAYDPGDGELTYRPISVVGVDVRPLLNPSYRDQIGELTSPEESTLTGIGGNPAETVVQADLARGLKDFVLDPIQDPDGSGDLRFVTEAHHELFQKTAEQVTKKLRNYLDLLEGGSVERPGQQVTIQQLREQLQALENPDSLAQIEAVSDFIVQASGWLDGLYNTFFLDEDSVRSTQRELQTGINRKTGQLLTPAERDTRINWVARQLAKQKHYLYLFDELGRFKQQLQELGYVSATQPVYDRGERLQSETRDILGQLGVSPGNTESVLDVLRSEQFTEGALRAELFRVLSVTHSDQPGLTIHRTVEDYLEQVLKSYPGKTVESVLDEALSKAVRLKQSLVEHHYELVTSWLWPHIQAKQQRYTGPDKLDRDQLKSLLKTAKEDEGIFQYGLDAPIQSSDPVTAIVASLTSDALYRSAEESRLNLSRLLSVREPLGLEKTMSPAQIEAYHRAMTHDTILPLEGPDSGEAGEDWDGPVLTVSVFGQTKRIKGYTKRAFLTEYNTALQQAHQKEFFGQLPGKLDELMSLVTVQDGYLDVSDLKALLQTSSQDEYLGPLLSKLFSYDRSMGSWQLRTNPTGPTDQNYVRGKLRSGLIQTFFSLHQQPLDQMSKASLFTRWNLLDQTGKPNRDEQTSINSDLQQNSQEYRLTDPELQGKLTGKKNESWLNNFVGYRVSDTEHYLYVRKLVINKTTGKPESRWSWVNIYQPGSLTNVTRLYYAKGELIRPADRYRTDRGSFGIQVQQQWADLQTGDSVRKTYFDGLWDGYERANRQLGTPALAHGVLPQVERLQSLTEGPKGHWERLWDWIKQHTLLSWVRDSYHWLTGEATEDQQVGRKPIYLDNSPVHQIRARYTSFIPDGQLEGDLFRSVLMYQSMASSYRELTRLDPQVQALRTLITGDTSLSLDPREALDKPVWEKKAGELLERQQSKVASRLNKKLTSFLDDVVYGESDYGQVYTLFNKPVDPQVLAKKMSGFTAFSNLAWNVSSMMGNIGVGFLSNYSEAVKGKYYRPEDWLSAGKDYWLSMGQGEFIRDLSEINPEKRSKWTQVASQLDAIQGEILDESGSYSRVQTVDKLMNRALFWTQSGAEHMIQMKSMIAQIRGFKLESGKTFYEAIEQLPNGKVEIRASPQEIRKFQQQLHSVNKQLHGHYSQFDKSMLQRHWLGQMLMMFKKYIYSSIRYRFGDSRFDWEAGDETEGHLRAYWKQIVSELGDQKGAFRKAAVLGNGMLLRPSLSAVDQLVGGQLGKLSPGLGNYLYGDESQLRNSAARQTGFDVLWYSLMILMAGFIHGLDEDDDPNGVALQNMEAFARRMEGDLGMYLPFYLGTGGKTLFSSYDKAWQLVKSPLAQLRAYDGTVNLLSQLTGVEHTEDGWDMSWNDTYSRDGAGYEKGESKLYHKVEKSLLGPLAQLNRLMNPEAQLQYLNLSRRNSQ
ncbi:hypothetical protein CLV58_109196 [Spirosoma oryzae]|uniref:Uncharacterized protein n=1 Tax=Spirosoma oryzae TaxID=1469603 RepID=A0A2T0SYK1_9BACT|nr:hypothetical protein [Spirosoma oryzae]PRY38469.1 hypothetical protein CLV58_109196 [Spirosoma oryzae]